MGERRGRLKELSELALRGEKPDLRRFFDLVNDYAAEKRKERKGLEEEQRFIRRAYDSFSLPERVRFFSMLYDAFSERYDEHMGVETNHYGAIRRLMGFAAPYLRLPLLDVTAGTGEPLKYALERIKLGRRMAELGLPGDVPAQESALAVANEISPKMLGIAKQKLQGVEFASHSAYDLPYGERFRTVLCSQTFHIIADEDKPRLVRSIHGALLPGGIAIIMEEDPFRISQTAPIEAVSLFLRAIVRPIKPQALIGLFEVTNFEKLEERAVSPIDSEHSMRLHIFRKSVTQE